MDNSSETLSREELLDLYKHYRNSIKGEIDLFHKFFNFYVGLLSAILAVTITGFLNIDDGEMLNLALLAGPILILVLSCIGYSNAKTFYRRFVEAWVTTINIESMLDLGQTDRVQPGIRQPAYKSNKGGFIPEVTWKRLKKVFDEAEKKSWSAEDLTQALVEKGSTLSQAKWTYVVFSVAAVVFGVAIVRTVGF
jgi:hypothetical protein